MNICFSHSYNIVNCYYILGGMVILSTIKDLILDQPSIITPGSGILEIKPGLATCKPCALSTVLVTQLPLHELLLLSLNSFFGASPT